jgi:nucleotide-binding universal stress UspA family protein
MYKIDSILCPTDFSASSIATIRYALIYAHQFKASLTLMYVDEYEQTPQGIFDKDLVQQIKRREQCELFAEELFQKIIKVLDIDKHHVNTIIKYGAAYKEIVLEAERGNYSAVIFPVQGIGCSTPHMIGRTAERIVRLCRVPVITLRPNVQKQFLSIKSILVPTDFSEYSNYSIPYAISLCLVFHAQLILLHITDLTVSEDQLSQIHFPDLQALDKRIKNISVEKLITRDVEPDNAIVNIAEDRNVDLIIMGTHGARGMRRTQIGNTTEEVVRRVTVPVLSITHPVHKMIFPRRFNEPLVQQ